VTLSKKEKASYAEQLARLGVEAAALADTLHYRGLISATEGLQMTNAGHNWSEWAARIDPSRKVSGGSR
jgi:hypothetical protein